MLYFTDRQQQIVNAIIANPSVSDVQLMIKLSCSQSTITKEMVALKRILGVRRREGIAPVAERVTEANKEQQVRRLVASDFKDGPLKELCVKGEMVHVEAAEMATDMWMAHEMKQPPTAEMVHDFRRKLTRVRAWVNTVDMALDELMKEMVAE